MKVLTLGLIVALWVCSGMSFRTGVNSNGVGPGKGLTTMTGLPPVYFCGESVPLHEGVVARRLVSALVQNVDRTRALYRIRQRAALFFPIIEPILDYYQIPADFKYLPLVESALLGDATSPKGAVGYWQFMPETARELGLRVDDYRDDRRNLLKSTDAACRYLRYLYNRLGSWTLAAAAYNNGIGRLLGSIRKQQQRDYYYLRLNAETGKYLYRILAFKELFANYRSYGNFLPESVLATLSDPLGPEAVTRTDDILLSETFVNEATAAAVSEPATAKTAITDEIPLPNAADVFRDGIKARLVEGGSLQRGQVWVFDLTRNAIAGKRMVVEGDRMYAIVEDIDLKNGRLYLRTEKIYSPADRATYGLTLGAIDASTGRIGINIPDVAQMKAGWILTWKVL